MSSIVKYFIYLVMIVVGLVAMYSILNAANPDSLLRPLFPDPRSDVYVAFVSSFVVFVLGFFVFHSRDREGFKQLIEINEKRIRQLRKKGKKDDEIAESILSAMGTRKGYRYNMARKKLVAYLSEFK